MRIIAIQDHLRTGGTEAQFLNLTRRWQAAGHEIHRVIFRKGGGLYRLAGDRVRLSCLQPFSTPFNWWAPGLRTILRRERPDRVICFGRNAHWSLSRSLEDRPYPGLVATVRGGRPIPPGYKRILRNAEAVVGNSHYARERALSIAVDPEKVTVIENGCRLAETPVVSRVDAREKLGASQDDLILLCVGSFVPGKSQGKLLELWGKLPTETRRKILLWFVGDGPQRQSLQKRASGLPDGRRIRFWGERDDPECFYMAADVTVSVSREESSPNALVESLWFGTPVLAIDCAGIRDMITEGDGFVYPPSREGLEAMRGRIGALADAGPAKVEFSSTPGAGVRARFDPEMRAGDYLKLMASLHPFSLQPKSDALS